MLIESFLFLFFALGGCADWLIDPPFWLAEMFLCCIIGRGRLSLSSFCIANSAVIFNKYNQNHPLCPCSVHGVQYHEMHTRK